ncbi:hypothetical protein B0A50_08592 [Salinomyces thailandicus]|uniref:Uncharacterized protein n=1 Tax=Salinomyces thailandicus TaxID=706561 RepID=A0A4U0TJZ3_9PEZI|nr:hypothetical protein B0A50_08592 [Salinomyces thailandica]
MSDDNGSRGENDNGSRRRNDEDFTRRMAELEARVQDVDRRQTVNVTSSAELAALIAKIAEIVGRAEQDEQPAWTRTPSALQRRPAPRREDPFVTPRVDRATPPGDNWARSQSDNLTTPSGGDRATPRGSNRANPPDGSRATPPGGNRVTPTGGAYATRGGGDRTAPQSNSATPLSGNRATTAGDRSTPPTTFPATSNNGERESPDQWRTDAPEFVEPTPEGNPLAILDDDWWTAPEPDLTTYDGCRRDLANRTRLSDNATRNFYAWGEFTSAVYLPFSVQSDLKSSAHRLAQETVWYAYRKHEPNVQRSMWPECPEEVKLGKEEINDIGGRDFIGDSEPANGNISMLPRGMWRPPYDLSELRNWCCHPDRSKCQYLDGLLAHTHKYAVQVLDEPRALEARLLRDRVQEEARRVHTELFTHDPATEWEMHYQWLFEYVRSQFKTDPWVVEKQFGNDIIDAAKAWSKEYVTLGVLRPVVPQQTNP